MKGVILAGGKGTRLFPLTKVTNKHLLPVGSYPMIYYPIFKFKEVGITDILVVTGIEHMGDVIRLLGSGVEFGVSFTYKVQDKAAGIAHALLLAEDFVGQDVCLVILGDNIFEDALDDFVKSYQERPEGAKVLLKEVQDPTRFGVPTIAGSKILAIEEKPRLPKSSYCVTGVYIYDQSVFSYIKKLKPSARGEYEITDVNNTYIEDKKLSFSTLAGWWTDAGTPESLLLANNLAKEMVLF
ncbi:MAG: hypothetical protein RLZ12_792 [Bacillota bacterium]|jgi:glucose-1-phosphate thymidylyltransferase